MNENNLQEIAYRRLAFKLFDKGKSTKQILHKIPRSRSWLFKWKRRFAAHGWSALDSFSKAPKHAPQSYDSSVRQLVLRIRRRLERAKVGLCGARAVWLELHGSRLVSVVPSLATINRWLRAEGFFPCSAATAAKAYYPAWQFKQELLFASCDWMARFLEGGEKVFVFHTIDHQSHALSQTIAPDKTTETACRHLLNSFQEVGLVDFLQIDNDAAFTGLGRKARVFGRFVRLCLYFGGEIVFIPPGEPVRNALVERVNGLWASGFFCLGGGKLRAFLPRSWTGRHFPHTHSCFS